MIQLNILYLKRQVELLKTIDTKSYLDTLSELTESGHEVSTVICGGSMLPFLAPDRDSAFLKKPLNPPEKGDIVLFRRCDGNYVLHRIKYIRNDGYYLIGDSQNKTEGPISSEQITAVVTSVKRKGKILTPKSIVWKFYSGFWLNIVPFRHLILKIRSAFGK